MSAPAPARQIAGAGCVLLVIAVLAWQRMLRSVGRSAAIRAMIVTCIVGSLAWIAMIEATRLLVWVTLR